MLALQAYLAVMNTENFENHPKTFRILRKSTNSSKFDPIRRLGSKPCNVLLLIITNILSMLSTFIIIIIKYFLIFITFAVIGRYFC